MAKGTKETAILIDQAPLLSRGVLRERRFIIVLHKAGEDPRIRYVGDLYGLNGTFSDEEFIEKLIAVIKEDGLLEKGRLRIYQASYTKVWDSREEGNNGKER